MTREKPLVRTHGEDANIVIAIDSFKGSLSSIEAGRAAAEGIRRVFPGARIRVCPLADGGEGTVEALTGGMGGSFHSVPVTGPFGKPVACTYGIIRERSLAVIEAAGAAGLTLQRKEELDPMRASSYGLGEVIRDAVSNGCREFIVGIGGSDTNDGGVGMLQALGYSFLDEKGEQIPHGAKGLEALREITDEDVLPELKDCVFHIACDVGNVLCGENGCSAVYGPQKGATAEMIEQMDGWLRSYAALANKKYPKADPEHPGCGAAGGLGFAFLTFTNATLEPGAAIVLRETGLETWIQKADIVLTGEGRLDGQTVYGKAPIAVARCAKRYGKPVLALAGSVRRDASECNKHGMDAFFPILREVITLEEALDAKEAKKNMSDTAEQVFRLIGAVTGGNGESHAPECLRQASMNG